MSSSFHENNDEDLKVIDVSPIKSLFCNMNLDNYGTEDDSSAIRTPPSPGLPQTLIDFRLMLTL